MKRHREESEDDANKKAHIETVETVDTQQRIIEALQSRIQQLENQLHSERQLAYKALREQERAFLEWQRSVERVYRGSGGCGVPRAIY